MKSKAPTMKDVARAAGVGLGTVSNVMNGIPVSEESRAKVEEAARELGYQVNPYARALKTNKSDTVGVILPNMTHPYFAQLCQDLYRALTERDHRMILFLTNSDAEQEQACIHMVRRNKADGIIGLTYSASDIDPDIPFISIDRRFGPNVPCVAADNYSGGYQAAEQLISMGCKRLLYLHSRNNNIRSEIEKRGEGFATACQERNVPFEKLRQIWKGDDRVFLDYFAAHMSDGKPDFDGIFCTSDILAVKIRTMLEELGCRIPEDVQIIGFDGIRDCCTGRYLCSTIVQPTREIARTCVDLLLRKDRTDLPPVVCLPITYVPGNSTKG